MTPDDGERYAQRLRQHAERLQRVYKLGPLSRELGYIAQALEDDARQLERDPYFKEIIGQIINGRTYYVGSFNEGID